MLTLSPDRLTALAACNTSSASRPATKRRESFWPSEERSARRRSDLLSERLMKKARSTVEKENLNFYHSAEVAVIGRGRSFARSPAAAGSRPVAPVLFAQLTRH